MFMVITACFGDTYIVLKFLVMFKWGGELAYCVTGSLDGSWSPLLHGVFICIHTVCV